MPCCTGVNGCGCCDSLFYASLITNVVRTLGVICLSKTCTRRCCATRFLFCGAAYPALVLGFGLWAGFVACGCSGKLSLLDLPSAFCGIKTRHGAPLYTHPHSSYNKTKESIDILTTLRTDNHIRHATTMVSATFTEKVRFLNSAPNKSHLLS